MSIDIYSQGSFSYTEVGAELTLEEFVQSTNPQHELNPGMKIVLEEKYLIGPGAKYDVNRHSFWVGDATPYHSPSENDGGFGWSDTKFMQDYGEWQVVEIHQYI